MSRGPASSAGDGPRREYKRRRDARAAEAERRQRQHLMLSNTRLAVFIVGAVLAWLAFVSRVIAGAWVLLPAASFAVLLALHNRVLRQRERARRSVSYYDAGLARLEHRWAGRGDAGERYRDEGHPYADDLDLFGTGSLYELLGTARTRAGKDMLAAWLQAPAPPSTVRARQAAVEELRPRLDLREDLAILGEAMQAGVQPEALARWAAAPQVLGSRAARVVGLALTALTVVTVAAWLLGPLGPAAAIAMLAVQGGFAAWHRHAVSQVTAAANEPGRELALLAAVLERLEREDFSSPLMAALRAALHTGGAPPSRRIAALGRWIDLLDWRRNQLFMPIALLLMWTTHIAFALEAWRRQVGPQVAAWLRAVGELEALGALAGYAWEHPGDPFPDVEESTDARIEARDIGHPLLPEATCVRNDLRLGDGLQLLIVSGSNMSGKSTLLRTVGINAVLAQAGAPVRARQLRLSPLVVGASIRINDSLQAGRSRFYAEITRLRQIMELASKTRTLLFLLDEILHGTNSHDRRIGAAALLRGLVERGALGLATTHDLALTQVAGELAGRADNIHFQDHLEGGRMVFDYRIHPGVVKKSNALELMRAVGLDV